ncbi:TrkA family potassium uptake protein [Petroclostridium sp. X23]|uniref:potassium channel family protein n=1 Tax=Petroclostridium sp. X23 TaxID=3045146 RepID=UPI0024ADA958|nr:TrkA family potassium uptake protein [Petroclostridium sp. X23]WHH58922.1 TrkA family potassium uptake protein [Petroclostridium sp. X23]
MRSFVVLGIGRFGESVAKTLYESGYEVLAIDHNEEIIQNMSEWVTHAVVGDVTDEHVLKSLGIRNFDVAIVAIGGNMESSILVTLLLKELGVKYILAKSQNELHAKVLSRVGADRVIFPERDMGIRVAYNLVSTNILDYIELSPDYSIVEITVPEKWEGKTLKELDVRAKYGINIMAIKKDSEINIAPRAEDAIRKDDILVVIGSNEDLNNLDKK